MFKALAIKFETDKRQLSGHPFSHAIFVRIVNIAYFKHNLFTNYQNS